MVFHIYGQILGVEPTVVRSALVNVILVDTVIIFVLFYFKPIKRVRSLFARYQPLKRLASKWKTDRGGGSHSELIDPHDLGPEPNGR